MSENWGHFRAAARVLVGSGAAKQRLIEAYLKHLAAVDERQLPESLCTEFAALMAAFNCATPAGGLSAAEVAVRKMSEHDAVRHAQSVLDMLTLLSARDMSESEPSAPPRLRVVSDEDEAIPAFLSRA